MAIHAVYCTRGDDGTRAYRGGVSGNPFDSKTFLK